MNMFKRWYDADTVVAKVINDMEKLPEDLQVKCAEYIIDDLLRDVELEEMSLDDQYNYIMRRWYDKNIKVSHAIEYLRLCPSDIRRQTALQVQKFMRKLI